ncbi:MAG: hypothetical protein ACTSUV_04345, partial [Candidatus Ranarchaeia archaeon]
MENNTIDVDSKKQIKISGVVLTGFVCCILSAIAGYIFSYVPYHALWSPIDGPDWPLGIFQRLLPIGYFLSLYSPTALLLGIISYKRRD